jgi:hypothetical protein
LTTEAPWTPLEKNTARHQEWVCPTYLLVLAWDPEWGGWFDFALYEKTYTEQVGDGVEAAQFYLPNFVSIADSTSNWMEAVPVVSGFVKWDGCTQFGFHYDLHFDHKDDLRGLLDAIDAARAQIAMRMTAAVADLYIKKEYDALAPNQ